MPLPKADITVAFTVSSQREKYLRESLDSWAHARGVQDVRLLFMMEPRRPPHHPFPMMEFKEFLARSFPHYLIVVNEERLGCLDNTRAAMDKSFATGAEFTILAEEDIAVADDVLEYFTWAQRFKDDPEVSSVCAHTFRAAPGTPTGEAVRVRWFSPLVWGTWPDEWKNFIRPEWAGCMGNPQAWDLNYRLQLVHADKYAIFPTNSRSIHIGHSSTLTREPLASYFYNASLTDCYHPPYGPQEWVEVPRTREYKLVV